MSGSGAPGDDPVVLYLAGVGRSGSTLLGQLLGQVPGFVNVGELLARYWGSRRTLLPCGCGEPVESCEFWTAVTERAYGGWHSPELAAATNIQRSYTGTVLLPLLLLSPWQPQSVRQRTKEFEAHVHRLVRAVAAVSGASVLVDGSKDPALAVALHRVLGQRLRVLHLVRNPNGVAYSWTKVVRKELVGEPDAEMRRYRPSRLAVRWLRRNGLLELLRPRTGALLVRYEDVAARPVTELARVITFAAPAGAVAPVTDDASVDLMETHSWGGNPMRMRSGQLTIRLDEQWRHQLPRRQRRLVTAITAPLMARYRYTGRRTAPTDPTI